MNAEVLQDDREHQSSKDIAEVERRKIGLGKKTVAREILLGRDRKNRSKQMRKLRELMIENPLMVRGVRPEWTVSIEPGEQGVRIRIVDAPTGRTVSEAGLGRPEGVMIAEALHLAAVSEKTIPAVVNCEGEKCFRSGALRYWSAYYWVTLRFRPVMGYEADRSKVPSGGIRARYESGRSLAGCTDSGNRDDRMKSHNRPAEQSPGQRGAARKALRSVVAGMTPEGNDRDPNGLDSLNSGRQALLEHVKRHVSRARMRPSVWNSWIVFRHEQTVKGEKEIPSYQTFRRAVRLLERQHGITGRPRA